MRPKEYSTERMGEHAILVSRKKANSERFHDKKYKNEDLQYRTEEP
jgi:hypothetical protein